MNMNKENTGRSLGLAAIMLAALVTGCSSSNNGEAVTIPSNAPTVTETSPVNATIAVSLNSKVTATFDKAMDVTSIDSMSFTVNGLGEPALTGTVSLDAATNTASFTSGSSFTASTIYTATLTSDVKSSAGDALAADYVWIFTSGTVADVTAPTVMSTNPADASTGFELNRSVSANFDEALDPASVNATSFTLLDGVNPVLGVVSYSNKVATFTPASNLDASTTYDATLTTAITDLAIPGNALVADVTWSFDTGTTLATGPEAINLRTAANFAVMTGTGVTSEDGSAAITGHIGASGITGASITVACTEMPGFQMFTDDATPVLGCVSADKGAASIALADVLTAYVAASSPITTAAVGPPFLELGAGTVTAQTLVPGVYTWAGNVTITGEVTLDGSATDVWVFQIDGTLDSNQNMILAGGALAKNVFWRVADVVTLGTGAQFKGVVLAKTKAVMITTATIEGRLLAQTEVNLGTGTVVTQPAP